MAFAGVTNAHGASPPAIRMQLFKKSPMFQHDPENNKACVPGGDDGNYIMFARATSGDKKNNRNFSPCSLKSIKPVLLAKARGPKGCFKGITLNFDSLKNFDVVIRVNILAFLFVFFLSSGNGI